MDIPGVVGASLSSSFPFSFFLISFSFFLFSMSLLPYVNVFQSLLQSFPLFLFSHFTLTPSPRFSLLLIHVPTLNGWEPWKSAQIPMMSQAGTNRADDWREVFWGVVWRDLEGPEVLFVTSRLFLSDQGYYVQAKPKTPAAVGRWFGGL